MPADDRDDGPSIDARVVAALSAVAGACSGTALVLDEPLSLWGGLDAGSGCIIDAHHPQYGASFVGTVVVMAAGRGSSSASSVLAEAARRGTGPRGFVLFARDEIIALGALVAEELYGTSMPVVIVDRDAVADVVTGTPLAIEGSSLIVG